MDARNIMGIQSDTEAEELLLWIEEQKSIRDRLIETDKAMIERYKEKQAQHEDSFRQITEQAMMVLGEYCKANSMRSTKTIANQTILPSGTLQWKIKSPSIVKDETTLTEWVKQYAPSFIATKESVKWDELKKQAVVVDNKYELPTADGEMIEVAGVELVEQPEVFEIK